MSDLVKTGDEIWSHVESAYHRYSIEKTKEEWRELNNRPKKKYLVLPSGLDKLEEMLKKEFPKRGFIPGGETIDVVEDIFARFKQEHGVK